jgi:hypothetical protein
LGARPSRTSKIWPSRPDCSRERDSGPRARGRRVRRQRPSSASSRRGPTPR